MFYLGLMHGSSFDYVKEHLLPKVDAINERLDDIRRGGELWAKEYAESLVNEDQFTGASAQLKLSREKRYQEYEDLEKKIKDSLQKSYDDFYSLRPSELQELYPLLHSVELTESEILGLAKKYRASYTCLKALADKGSRKLAAALQDHVEAVEKAIDRIPANCRKAVYSDEENRSHVLSMRDAYQGFNDNRIANVQKTYDALMDLIGCGAEE